MWSRATLGQWKLRSRHFDEEKTRIDGYAISDAGYFPGISGGSHKSRKDRKDTDLQSPG